MHTGQAIELGWRASRGGGLEECGSGCDGGGVEEKKADGNPEEGREEDICSCCRDEIELSVDAAETGTKLRGTPHSVQIRAAVGLSPGGLRLPHTSHSQLSNALSASRSVVRLVIAVLPIVR